jgi:uncharacterized protein
MPLASDLMVDTVSGAQARRIALAAQGFGRSPVNPVGTRQLNGVLDRLGLLQLDSVNVFERSHYLPVFARLGGYDKALLDRLTFARTGRYIEYWAHEAAVIPVESWPLMRWRMQQHRDRSTSDPTAWSQSNQPMIDWLRAELAEKGPLPARAIEHDANKRRGPWWGWSDVKRGLEAMFRWGDVVSAGRSRFERVYALPEQVLPTEVLGCEIDRHDAHRQLLARAARAYGIGTASDLADYYRLKSADVKPALAELVDSGELLPVTVAGWDKPAFMHRDARVPRKITASALLSPFDPMVWYRDRAHRMFDFHYRIEIYTPAPKRVFGYYSLPVLVDDKLVGRVDLKSDRQASVLRVQSAWREAHAPAGIEERIVPLLQAAQDWQGLERIEVVDRGDLAQALAGAVGSRSLG